MSEYYGAGAITTHAAAQEELYIQTRGGAVGIHQRRQTLHAVPSPSAATSFSSSGDPAPNWARFGITIACFSGAAWLLYCVGVNLSNSQKLALLTQQVGELQATNQQLAETNAVLTEQNAIMQGQLTVVRQTVCPAPVPAALPAAQ